MKLRPAVKSDLEELTRIYNQAITKGGCTGDTKVLTAGQRSSWYEEHSDPKYPLIVCEKDGNVAGYATLSAYRPGRQAFSKAREVSYYVAEEYQAQGVGDLLMQGLLGKAHELGLHTLLAIILECNVKSLNLIEKYGFTLWGKLPDVAEFSDVTAGHLYYGLRL